MSVYRVDWEWTRTREHDKKVERPLIKMTWLTNGETIYPDTCFIRRRNKAFHPMGP